MAVDVAQIVARGWRQGAVFSAEDSQALVGDRYIAGSRLVLASQDCDIVHRGNREPFIDAFCATPIAKASPMDSKARNARCLHLELQIDGRLQPFEIRFWSRCALPREVLCYRSPDATASLATGSTRVFVKWLSSRYGRPALPDEFNARLAERDARKALRQILEPIHHCYRDIFLFLDPPDEELAKGTPYSIKVALVMADLDAQRQELVDQAQGSRDQLEKFLSSCPDIKIDAVEVMTDADFTLADLDAYRMWDFTDLSFEDDPAS